MLILPEDNQVKVQQAGLYVVLTHKGHRIELPWRAAERLAVALKVQSNRAAEIEKHNQIAFDQAILMRKGIRLGLTDNPYIKREAKIEAAHNTDLRKYIPHVDEGIRSREVVGTPKIKKHRRNNGG